MVTTKKAPAKAEKKAEPKAAAPKKEKAPKAPTAHAAGAPATAEKQVLGGRKVIVGTVSSDKMQKTIVVKVDRQVRHGAYKKYIFKSRKYKAHDEKNEAKVGDRVELIESRPLSREKRWVLKTILRKAGQLVEANV